MEETQKKSKNITYVRKIPNILETLPPNYSGKQRFQNLLIAIAAAGLAGTPNPYQIF